MGNQVGLVPGVSLNPGRVFGRGSPRICCVSLAPRTGPGVAASVPANDVFQRKGVHSVDSKSCRSPMLRPRCAGHGAPEVTPEALPPPRPRSLIWGTWRPVQQPSQRAGKHASVALKSRCHIHAVSAVEEAGCGELRVRGRLSSPEGPGRAGVSRLVKPKRGSRGARESRAPWARSASVGSLRAEARAWPASP